MIFEEGLVIFVTGFVFAAILKIVSPYFYAMEKNIYAYTLIYGEVIILSILVFLLPTTFGLGLIGVWAAVPVSQVILSIIAIILVKKTDELMKLEG